MNNINLNQQQFDYVVPGKWILAGEHTVIRGGEALVFPLKSRYLKFSYKNDSDKFRIILTGIASQELELIIWSVFEKCLDLLKKNRDDIKGTLHIHSEIQFGVGQGASATLSVGLTQFFEKIGFLTSDSFVFAKSIEDLFHGESSGVDIAVALYQKPLSFIRHQPTVELDTYYIPPMTVSYCGIRGVTKDCVTKVKKMITDDPDKSKQLDDKMKKSVSLMKSLMMKTDSGVDQWKMAIDMAQDCFLGWDLVPAEAEKHISLLKKNGALSCKMTGSGGGGYILSLWPSQKHIESLSPEIKQQLTLL